MLVLLLGAGLVLGGFPAVYGQEEEDEKSKGEEMAEFTLEEVVVTSERGEVMALDRAMTVTGFNEQMVEKMGIETVEDLQVLVPGLQVGNRSQGGAKGEDDHYYMRGIGSERTVNFGSDTAVAVYVDGVWTDQTYGTDGFFDVDRIEVTRGPQGTTGGRAALAGAISFHSRKPTETFDAILQAEYTDQFTQQYQVAFGGPIMDSDFSYRLRASYLTGEGQIENVYPGGRDGGEPEQFIFSPQLRWKTNRWDVTLRYSNQKDTGTPMTSLPLGARNTVDEFNLDPDGNPICSIHPVTGVETCSRNPFYGANPAPAVANCDNISQDGTRDENNIICDPDDLEHKVAFNAPISQDNSAEVVSIDAIFNITESLVLNYKGGWRDTVDRNKNDMDQLPREGGGVCPWNHPKVLGGMLTEGQTSRYCALDGGGDGSFADQGWEIGFLSEQWSHEISLYSNFDGPFNFTVGAVYIDGDEPLDYRYWESGSTAGNWAYEDTSAKCEAALVSLYGPGGSISGGENWLLRDVRNSDEAMAAAFNGLYACPGSPELLSYPKTGTQSFKSNLNGETVAFLGSTAYTSNGVYFNLEYVINDAFKVFGGARYDKDVKDRQQNTYAFALGLKTAAPSVDYGPDWGVYPNYCNNDSGEDCFAVIQVPLRDGSIVGLEGKHDAEWDATTWNVGVEYRPYDELMVYGRVSTGYRAGGFFGYARQNPPHAIDAEELINYEIGAKGMLFDNAVQLEASYFYQDFDNYWIFASRFKSPAELAADPYSGPVTSEVTNNDGTTIGGIELQAAWRINESFTLRGFYNWLDASIGDFEAIYPFDIPGVVAPWQQLTWNDAEGNPQSAWIRDQKLNYGGNQLPNQPEHKGSLTLAYETPLPSNLGSLEVLTTYSYTGKKYVELGNIEAYAVDPYKRWDVRAAWRSLSQKYTVTLFVQNALDQAGLQMWSPREGTGSPVGTMVEPREIGLTITWRY